VVSVDLVRGPDAPPYAPPVPITVAVTYVDNAVDPRVLASPSSATITSRGSATFTLTVKPPANAVSTTYIGEAVVTNNATGSVNRQGSHHPPRVIYGASAAVDPHEHATSQAPKPRSTLAEVCTGKLPISPDGEPDQRHVGKSPTDLYLKCKVIGSPRATWNSLRSPDSNLHVQSVAPLIDRASGHLPLTSVAKLTKEVLTATKMLKEYGTCMHTVMGFIHRRLLYLYSCLRVLCGF